MWLHTHNLRQADNKAACKCRAAFLAAIVLLAAVFAVPGHARSGDSSQGPVVHVIMMWFEDAVGAGQRQAVIELTRSFIGIPGVIEVRVGEPLDGGRGNVDSTYSIGACIVFEDAAALETYQMHPIHLDAKRSGALEGLVKMVVYDFLDAPPAENP